MREVWIRRRRWRIVGERVGDGLTWLTASADANGEIRSFLSPCEPTGRAHPARCRMVARHQALARLAGHVAHTRPAFAPVAIVTARVAVHAYQLEPALAAAAGRRRILIADGVGLGKTIQAGLITASLVAERADTRALIIAPAGLLAQWQSELAGRFGLAPCVADAGALARARAFAPYLSSPWLQPGVWLTSPDFIKQPHIAAGLPSAAWDLLIVDEAHGLAGASQRHDVCDDLARRAHRVVLLTATPHDGDQARHSRLMSLGARDTHDRATVFRRTARPAGATRRTHWLHVTLSDTDRRVLALIDRFESRHRRDTADAPTALGLICAVFRRRALSSPDALRASIDRRLLVIGHCGGPAPRQPALFELDVFEADELVLDGESGVAAEAEQLWLRRLRGLADGPRHAGRLRALSALLRRSREPVVIFTQYRDTLASLRRAVPAPRRSVCLHGGQSVAEQATARAQFLDGDCDTLIATDVASQGLNLHTASRWVICHDVPATPLRLEQRIGRVDRLGQPRRVHLIVLTSRHPADVTLRQRLDARSDRVDDTPLSSCTRWTNAAAGLATWFDRVRRLNRHWRHPAPPRAVTVHVPREVLHRWTGTDCHEAACFIATFADANGTVVERRIVVAAPNSAEARIRATLERRATALTARLRRRERRAQADSQTSRLAPTRQPGLFFDHPRPVEPSEDDGSRPTVVRLASLDAVVRVKVRR